MPIEHEQHSSFIGSITYEDQKVKIDGKSFSEVFKEHKFSYNSSREETGLADLRKENTKLKAQVEYWRNQTKVTDHPTLREGDVKKATNEILEDYESTANKEQVAKQIKSLGETILAGGKELSWTAVKDEAAAIARNIAVSLILPFYSFFFKLSVKPRCKRLTFAQKNRII